MRYERNGRGVRSGTGSGRASCLPLRRPHVATKGAQRPDGPRREGGGPPPSGCTPRTPRGGWGGGGLAGALPSASSLLPAEQPPPLRHAAGGQPLRCIKQPQSHPPPTRNGEGGGAAGPATPTRAHALNAERGGAGRHGREEELHGGLGAWGGRAGAVRCPWQRTETATPPRVSPSVGGWPAPTRPQAPPTAAGGVALPRRLRVVAPTSGAHRASYPFSPCLPPLRPSP